MNSVRVVIILAVGAVVLGASALADVPTTISVQGRLTDAAGDPVAPGTKSFEFKIFDQVSGGVEIWPAGMGDEIQTISTDANGLWSGQVGAVRALSAAVFESGQLWMEVTVDDGINPPEVMPRTKLNTNPFAYRVGTVDGADGGRITDNVEAPSFSAGNASENGTIWVYQSGNTKPVVTVDSYSGLGGQVTILDESASTVAVARADEDGDGGYFKVNGANSASLFFEVDGNASGTGVPKMTLRGDHGSVVMDPHTTGNASVALPESAVSAAEMYDEPGVASETYTGSMALTGGVQILRQRDITAPANGFVLAIASCHVRAVHTQFSVPTDATFGVSDDPETLPANQQVTFYMTSNANTGNYYCPATFTGLFEVSAGLHTFYFLGDENYGDVYCAEMQFTLIYFPTSYGTVTPTVAASSDIPTDRFLVREENSIPASSERVDEIAQLRQDVAMLRSELEALKQASPSGGN